MKDYDYKYDMNYKIGDIVIGVNSEDEFSYLRLFKLKDIIDRENYGTIMILEYMCHRDSYHDCNNIYYSVLNFNKYFKKVLII